MKKSLQNKLTVEFSSLFRNDDKPYFACGNGWFDLLRRLFTQLISMKVPADYKIITVKEKHAGLNVWGYSDLEPEQSTWIRDVISEFELESYSICEQCGSMDGIQFFTYKGCEKVACYPCREKIKLGWQPDDATHPDQNAVKTMMTQLMDKFNEASKLFPEGTNFKVILRTEPKKSYIIVKTPDGQVCGF